MLRFIKNKAKRRSGSNVDLIKVTMPLGETLPVDDTKESRGKEGKKAVESNSKPAMNGVAKGIRDHDYDPKSPLYAEPDEILKSTNGVLGENDSPEMGIDLDDLLKEVEKDLKVLTDIKYDNKIDDDVIYAKPQKPPSKPPRQKIKMFADDKSEESGNDLERERTLKGAESTEDDSDEDTRTVIRKPKDPRKDETLKMESNEHLSRDSFVEGNHDVMVVKDGVPYIFPANSDSGSDEYDKPESERSYGRSFRIDPKNPYGLKEVTPSTMMTTFASDTPVTVSCPLLLQDTNLLVANGHVPNMPSSVPIRNGSFKLANGNGNRRVQFRDDSSVISDGNTVKKVPIDAMGKEDELVVIEEGIDDKEGQNTDDEDALSLGSEASDMSESDLRPRTLRTRRTIAVIFAWICMVSTNHVALKLCNFDKIN